MYVIYIDVLFIINSVMDFIIFKTLTLIFNRSISVRRHLIAALIASSLFCLLVICPFLYSIPYSLYSLWIPVIPILYLYKPRYFKEFIQTFIIATFIAALYGGIIFNIWYALGGDYSKVYTMSMFLLIGISMLVLGLIYFCIYWIKKAFILNQFTYRLKIRKNQKEKELIGIMDTGNLLYSPIYHHPVIVITYKAIKDILTEQERELLEQFFKIKDDDVEKFIALEQNGPEMLIPFNSVGCEVGFLWGMKIDEMIVEMQEEKKCIYNCLVGITNKQLYSDRKYEVLLHPEYIVGRNKRNDIKREMVNTI